MTFLLPKFVRSSQDLRVSIIMEDKNNRQIRTKKTWFVRSVFTKLKMFYEKWGWNVEKNDSRVFKHPWYQLSAGLESVSKFKEEQEKTVMDFLCEKCVSSLLQTDAGSRLILGLPLGGCFLWARAKVFGVKTSSKNLPKDFESPAFFTVSGWIFNLKIQSENNQRAQVINEKLFNMNFNFKSPIILTT